MYAGADADAADQCQIAFSTEQKPSLQKSLLSAHWYQFEQKPDNHPLEHTHGTGSNNGKASVSTLGTGTQSGTYHLYLL